MSNQLKKIKELWKNLNSYEKNKIIDFIHNESLKEEYCRGVRDALFGEKNKTEKMATNEQPKPVKA